MKICEVINSIVYSFPKVSSGTMNSFPYIKNLLGIKKSEKEKAIKQAYEDFIHLRKETIILTSISTSSKLFTFVLTHTPRIHFWMKCSK